MLEWLFSVVSKLQWVRLSSNDTFVPPSLDKNDLFSRRDSFPSVQQSQVKNLNAFSWRRWIPALDSVVAILASAECNWTQVIIVFICGACNGVGYDNHLKKNCFLEILLFTMSFTSIWSEDSLKGQMETLKSDSGEEAPHATGPNLLKVDFSPLSYGFIFFFFSKLFEDWLESGNLRTMEEWEQQCLKWHWCLHPSFVWGHVCFLGMTATACLRQGCPAAVVKYLESI